MNELSPSMSLNADVGGAPDDPVHPVADAVERVHVVRPHEQPVQRGADGEDEGQPDEHAAAEQRGESPASGVQDGSDTRGCPPRRASPSRHEPRQLDDGHEAEGASRSTLTSCNAA